MQGATPRHGAPSGASPSSPSPSAGLTVVIGAGPAGSACALWLHQLGCPVLLVDRNAQAGGLQQFSPYENLWIPSIRGLRGQDIAGRLHEHLQAAGVPMRLGLAVEHVEPRAQGGFRIACADASVLECGFAVIATGARFKTGGFTPGERLSIGPGRDFEAVDVQGKSVAVLGGGDNAFDAYRFAMARGAVRCRIFARTLRAQHKLQALVGLENVQTGPFTVDAPSFKVNGEAFDVISVQFGFEPVVPGGLQDLERSHEGYLKADLWGVTGVEGLYAAGEVTHTLHPCVTTSLAHGVQVAKHIQGCLGL